MELYNLMKNITNIDKEETIKECINKVKNDLEGLTTERTCLIYCGHLFQELRNKHVLVKLLTTKEFNVDYLHEFLLVPNDEETYFLIDLTFSQFEDFDERFSSLLETGYQLIDEDQLNLYLNIIKRKTTSKSIR